MARKAGRSSRLYVARTTGGAAVPVAATASFSVDMTRDSIDVTAQGDTSRQSLTGLPSGSGNFEAFYDSADVAASFVAAVDGLSRKVYGYPDAASDAVYFFTSALFSASMQTDVAGAVRVSGTWTSDSGVNWVGVS